MRSKPHSVAAFASVFVAVSLFGAPWFAAIPSLTNPSSVFAQDQLAAGSSEGQAAQPLVAAVRVEGNQRVETSAISTNVHQPIGEPVAETIVDEDIKAIYAMGFFENVWVTREAGPAGLEVVYHVAERAYVNEIVFEGIDNVEVEDIEALVGIRARTIFDPKHAWEGLQATREFYAKEGYPDVVINYSLDVDENNEAVLTYTIDEAELIRIHSIKFEGVEAFSQRKLRKVMATRKSWMFSWVTGAGVLNDEELATDMERLTAFYYDAGYIHVRIDEPTVERDEDGLVVTVRVEEGDQYRVGEVEFDGGGLVEDAVLLAATRLEPGEIFKPSQLREGIFAVTEAYGNLGYAFAEVTPLTNTREEDLAVDIRFQVETGPIVSVRRIDVRGNSKTRDFVVRREMRLREGELFSGTGLRTSRDRVRRLGHFDDVEITSNRAEKENEVDLVVQVREGRTGSFSAGAGFSSADNFLANARITERNLFGRGQVLDLSVDVGSRRQNARVGFTEPWFLGIPLTLGVEVFDWRFQFDRFTRGGRGVSIRTGYPLWELGWRDLWGFSLDAVRVGFEYRLESAVIEGVDNFAPPSIQREQGSRLTSSVRPTITRNTIDHPFDPTRGSRQILSAEFAGLGADTDFIKLEASSRHFIPLYTTEKGRSFVYSVNGSIGFGIGDSGASGEELPLFERYFPGGISTVRGYDPRSLGPREREEQQTNGQPDGQLGVFEEVGGSQQLIINNELITPLFPEAGVKGVLFFDAGQAFTAAQGISITDLRTTFGVEVRWLSPLGPLRVALGFPLNDEDNDDTSTVLFSFGSPF